ncbi:MAPEG family protein [Pseudoalteromonas sp. MMG012]|uniref:MAPEG family protein n=1 Tax=Pseudoalteromonas sp. MMG012 TaxID=2822686 RepID=UPI001B3A695E|nr:MAPEG family protein [Pseudoalteromonas sp. MMG012]MBQ4852048.1 MAPEG family protein [Pseudoalteromonas sp. MMG012]
MTISLYAALLILFYIKLSFEIIAIRKKQKVGLGDGGNRSLTNAIRAHANFSEYTPLTLILLFILEFQGISSWVVHTAGVVFLVARVIHWQAIKRENLKLRVVGMALTFLVLSGLSATSLIVYIV